MPGGRVMTDDGMGWEMDDGRWWVGGQGVGKCLGWMGVS